MSHGLLSKVSSSKITQNLLSPYKVKVQSGIPNVLLNILLMGVFFNANESTSEFQKFNFMRPQR